MIGEWGGGWGLEGDFGQREMVNARARETMIWMSAMRFRMGTDESAEQDSKWGWEGWRRSMRKWRVHESKNEDVDDDDSEWE
jgi:hypothetical protein